MADKIDLYPDETEAWDAHQRQQFTLYRNVRHAVVGVAADLASEEADALILERRARIPVPPVTVGHPCEKCGHVTIKIAYQSASCFSHIPGDLNPMAGHIGEHHHVTCASCNAKWTEEIVGAAGEARA